MLISEVSVRQAVSLGASPQKDGKYVAIWDTGASMTAVSPTVARELDLKAISAVTVHYGNESADSPVYKVDIMLPNQVGLADVNVSEAKNIQGADILIGMDIITTGDFAVTNARGQTCFSFRFPPAIEHIDYAVEAGIVRQKRERRLKTKQLRKRGKLR